MSGELDEKDFEFKGTTYHVGSMERHTHFGSRRKISRVAASPSPSMEMEVVAWRYHSGAKGTKWTVQKNHPVEVARWNGYTVEPLVTLSQAQSALAARDAQVLRLTEENEALVAWFDGLTPNEMHEAIKRDKARIKALEEALRPFANEADQWEGFEDSEALVEGWNGGPASSVNVGSLRSARSALKENAL